MLTLIDRFRMFARAASVDDRIGSNEIAVYTMLLSIDNDLMFQEWFGCSDRRLQDMIQVGSVHTITKAKNRLKQLGWIDFKASGKKTTLYKLTVPDRATECATDSAADSATDRKPSAIGCATDTATGCAIECATDTATDSAALNRQDKTARQLDKSAAAGARDDPLEDKELGEVVRTFEENIHPITGGIERDKLIDLTDEYGASWVTEAIKEAALSNGRSLRYITRILERWNRDGFKAKRKKGGGNYGTGIIQGHMAGDGAEKSPYAAYFDGDAGAGAGDIAGGTTTESRDPPSDLRLAGTGAFRCGASSGGGSGGHQART